MSRIPDTAAPTVFSRADLDQIAQTLPRQHVALPGHNQVAIIVALTGAAKDIIDHHTNHISVVDGKPVVVRDNRKLRGLYIAASLIDADGTYLYDVTNPADVEAAGRLPGELSDALFLAITKFNRIGGQAVVETETKN